MINIDILTFLHSTGSIDAPLANKVLMKFSSHSVHFYFSFRVFSFHNRHHSSIKAEGLFHESLTLPGADHSELGKHTTKYYNTQNWDQKGQAFGFD